MYIASSSTTVKFHSFPDGDLLYNYQPGSKVDGPVRDISWSKDGSWLSLVPKSGLAEIISVRSQLKLIHTIVDVEEPSCTAFQNTTKKFIAYGTKNGQVLVYDIKSKKIRNRYPRASSLISHVEFTAKDTHLVAGCLNGEVLLYSNLTFALSCTYKIPRSESVSALRTNPTKRNFIIGGSNEGVVVVWDTNVNKHKFYEESHKAPVTGVAFSPINPDLILSTGSDRQFCCYDILSNKCIASIPVNNNMTAVDFSHDGTHFVMASQEGNICLYDARRISEPVLIFEAHKSTIKNIAFQKTEISNSNSCLSEDKTPFQPNIQNQEDDVNVSFGALLQTRPEAGDVPDGEAPSMSFNRADSFMVAMGLGNGTTMGSTKQENFTFSQGSRNNYGEGDYKWNESATIDNHNQTGENIIPEKEKLSLYEKRSMLQRQTTTSTPNFPMVPGSKLEPGMSPIIPNMEPEADPQEKARNCLVPIEQIKQMTEDIVRKEMTEMLNSFSYEMKYQFSSSSAQMRRMHLDMQISMVKEFIKMENSMNALREDLASNSPMSENYLLEENLRLKKQIALLEEQLANNGNQ